MTLLSAFLLGFAVCLAIMATGGWLWYRRHGRAIAPAPAETSDDEEKIVASSAIENWFSGCVDDVMTPRPQIQALDIAGKPAHLRQQIAGSHHLRLPVYEGSLDRLVGVLDLRDALRLFTGHSFDAETLRALLRPAYYIPAGTPLLKQLKQFQNDRQRLGFVVDEYGELQGLVTLEDLAHEAANALAHAGARLPADAAAPPAIPDVGIVVDAGTSLRTLNRRLGCHFPLTGPKTLSGLIVETLGDIPEAGVQFVMNEYNVEILQTKQHAVRVVKLRPVAAKMTESSAFPLQTSAEQASS